MSSEARLMQSFEGFVENVESKGINYTAEQWEKSVETYEKYVSQFDEFSNRYTPEQIREVGRLKARYHKSLLIYCVNVASDFLDNISYQFDGYVDKMSMFVRDEDDDLRKSVSDLEGDYEESVDRITDAVDRFSTMIDELE